MKTNEKSALTDKEELKKIIAEVKAIVASIIPLPAEKKVCFRRNGELMECPVRLIGTVSI